MSLERFREFSNSLNDLDILVDDRELVRKIFEAGELFIADNWDNVPFHCLAVAKLGQVLAKIVGLNRNQIRTIILAGLLHDVGKYREKTLVNQLVAEGKSIDEAYTQAADEQV